MTVKNPTFTNTSDANFENKSTFVSVASGMNSGEMVVSVDTVKDAKAYHFDYTADPLSDTSNWITETDTRSTHEFAGLKPGQKYWFRVAAIGVRSTRVYSNVVASFVK